MYVQDKKGKYHKYKNLFFLLFYVAPMIAIVLLLSISHDIYNIAQNLSSIIRENNEKEFRYEPIGGVCEKNIILHEKLGCRIYYEEVKEEEKRAKWNKIESILRSSIQDIKNNQHEYTYSHNEKMAIKLYGMMNDPNKLNEFRPKNFVARPKKALYCYKLAVGIDNVLYKDLFLYIKNNNIYLKEIDLIISHNELINNCITDT